MRNTTNGAWKRKREIKNPGREKKNKRFQIQKGGGKNNRNSGTTWTCCPWASETWTSNLAGNCCWEDVRDLKWKLTIFLFTSLWGGLADLNIVWFDTSDIPAGSRITQLRIAQAIPHPAWTLFFIFANLKQFRSIYILHELQLFSSSFQCQVKIMISENNASVLP